MQMAFQTDCPSLQIALRTGLEIPVAPTPTMSLVLTELDDDYSIMRFDPSDRLPSEVLAPTGSFVSVTRSATELSVIAPTRTTHSSGNWASAARSDGWRCLRVETTTLPDETPGIIAAVVSPLADAGISVFAVASFDTDHILVQDAELAGSVLRRSGHQVAAALQTPTSTQGTVAESAAVQLCGAVDDDSASLSILADAATRRLISWLWDQGTATGQSSFEAGRQAIRGDAASLSHLDRWRVARSGGKVAGGLNSYVLPPLGHPAQSPDVAEVLSPLNELKSIAEGTWYISVASVFPEFRGQGVGQALLGEAERLARSANINKLTLMVGSFNVGAHRLYERVGFYEWARRPFVSFPGADVGGDWILMTRDLS